MTTSTTSGLSVHRAVDRGHTDLGWLDSRHSFSFGDYHDPVRSGYRALRVLNDDRVVAGAGFAMHGHRDMEILSWVLAGGLEHADSTGRRGFIQPGELQVMSAGTGIRHSEKNASTTDPVHFLQIWIEPTEPGLPPSYAQRHFDAANRLNRWQRIASGPIPSGAALLIRQDASLSVADLQSNASLDAAIPPGRYGYLHVATGAITVGGLSLSEGDAVSVAGDDNLAVRAVTDAHLLLFDLA